MAHRLIFHFRSFMQLVNDVKPCVNGKFQVRIGAATAEFIKLDRPSNFCGVAQVVESLAKRGL